MALVPAGGSVGAPGCIPGDPYIRLKLLGQGSFGRVLLVRDSRLAAAAAAAGDPGMALFVLKEVDLQQFGAKGRKEALKEVAFLNQLSHPYIISYKEFYERIVPVSGSATEGTAASAKGAHGQLVPLGKEDAQAAAAGGKRMLYIVMEYADGGDLDAKIKRQKKQHSAQLFPEAQILDWFVQLVLALKHIHDRRILHRDIKAENIFLHRAPDGSTHVKVGDFGISKTLASTMAQAMTRIGTPYYLSPEICMNKPYNQKSDIWSLGVVLYELCTLRHPFDANSMESLLRKIVKTAPSPLNARVYSPELRSLVDALLSKDPRKRPGVKDLCRMDFLQPHIEKHLSRAQLREEFSHTMIHDYSPVPLPQPAYAAPPQPQQLQPLQQLPPPQVVRKKKQRAAVPPQPLPPAVALQSHHYAAAAALPPPSSRPLPAPGIRAVKKVAPTHLPSPYAQQLSQHHPQHHQHAQPQRRNSSHHAAAAHSASEDEDDDGGPAPVHRVSSKQRQQEQAVPRQKRRSQGQQYSQQQQQSTQFERAPSYSPPVSALDIDADELQRFRAYEAALMAQRERERDLERERVKERELQKQLAVMKVRAPASFPGGSGNGVGEGTPQRHPVQQAPPAAGMSEGAHRRRRPEQYGARDGIVGSGPLPSALPRVHPNGMLPPAGRRYDEQQQHSHDDDIDDRYSEQDGGGRGDEYASTRVRASERARREEEELAAIRETYQAEKAARRARRLAESEATRHNILPVDERIATSATHTQHAPPPHHHRSGVSGSQGSRASSRAPPSQPPPPYGATATYEDDFEQKEEATYRGAGGGRAAAQEDESYEADEYEADFDEAPLPPPVAQQQQHRRFPSVSKPAQQQSQGQSHQRRRTPSSGTYAAPPPVLPSRGIPAKPLKKQHHLQQQQQQRQQ